MSAELVLHLELNGFEVIDQKEIVKDASGKQHIGALQGQVDIVADDTFGACVCFDGDASNYIHVPSDNILKITGDVTVAAWVYMTGEHTRWVRVVGKGTSDSRSYGLWYTATGTTTRWLFQRRHGPHFSDCEVELPRSTTPFNTWCHVTGVVEGKKALLYVHDLQGKCIAQHVLDDVPADPALHNDAPLTIGYSHGYAGDHLAHTGRMAHVRVYNGPCSQAEIERDIARDRQALVPFRKSHPIDFHLYDDDDQAVLYISDDPAGHNLHLELHNTSTQVIQLRNGQNAVASEANHHFAMRFRPGTLSDSTLKALVNPQEWATLLQQAEQWDLYFPPTRPAANAAATLYLLYKGPATSFQPDERRTLTLPRMSAAPGSGARGTQVELLPHQLTAAGGDATLITGSRTQYVHITNQIGHKNIPLHAWFEDGNTVLNDGVSCTDLTLCIGNASGDRDITLTGASKFLISFDVGNEADAAWALTTSEHESNVSVKSGGIELPLTAAGQGISRQWSLQFPEGKVLPKRGSDGAGPLKITIEGIKTSPQASGHANLYVRYEGIPGYQDGQFILTVEKSPLVSHEGRVGIGMLKPEAPLHIKGDLRIDGTRTVINGFDGVKYHWIRTSAAEPGSVFMAFTGTRDGKAEAVRIAPGLPPDAGLSVQHDGHVGIGAGNPGAKLEIALEDKDTTTSPLVVRKGATNYLTIRNTGEVGIGTRDPTSQLTINEKIVYDSGYVYSAAPLSIFLPLEKHNGGSKPAGTEDILHLVREGVREAAFGNKVSLAIGRYEHNGLNSRTQLGIKLTDGHFQDHNAVLSLRSNGNIGIGTTTPDKKLEVMNGSLQVTASHIIRRLNTPDAADIGMFYCKNKVQGIGISSNRIAAIGTADHNIYIKPKGINDTVVVEGSLRVEGPLTRQWALDVVGAVVVQDLTVHRSVEVRGPLTVNETLRVNGLPIFDYGMRMTREQYQDYAQKLKASISYRPGCFILFVREDESDDICCLVKKSNNEVRLLTFYCSSNTRVD